MACRRSLVPLTRIPLIWARYVFAKRHWRMVGRRSLGYAVNDQVSRIISVPRIDVSLESNMSCTITTLWDGYWWRSSHLPSSRAAALGSSLSEWTRIRDELAIVELNFFGGDLHLVGLVNVGVDQGCVEGFAMLVLVGAGDLCNTYCVVSLLLGRLASEPSGKAASI